MTTLFQLIHVLVVEDDESQHVLMERFLDKLGVVHFQFALSGDEALIMLRQELFHVVLIDINKLGMNDRQLVEAIRGDNLIRHMKLAMLSGKLTPENGEDEAELRAFLWRHNVLPVPKKGLDSNVVGRAITTLVGF